MTLRRCAEATSAIPHPRTFAVNRFDRARPGRYADGSVRQSSLRWVITRAVAAAAVFAAAVVVPRGGGNVWAQLTAPQSVGGSIASGRGGPTYAAPPNYGRQTAGPQNRRMQPGASNQNYGAATNPQFRIAQNPNGLSPAGLNTNGVNSAAANLGNYPAGAGSAIPGLPPENSAAATDGSGASDGLLAAVLSIYTRLRSGGVLMIPLGVCSLLVVALSMERLIALRRARVIPRPFVRRFTECVEDGQLSHDEATAICDEFDCPVAEVFRAALRRWGRPMLEVEQAVMDAGDRVSDSLRRFVRVFHAISNVAPLLGLLGTVVGMIASFDMISDPESAGRPELLAAGIGTALVTTAAGLTVAIPAYLAYMYFSAKTDRYLSEIDRLCTRVIDCISAETLDGAARRKKRAA